MTDIMSRRQRIAEQRRQEQQRLRWQRIAYIALALGAVGTIAAAIIVLYSGVV